MELGGFLSIAEGLDGLGEDRESVADRQELEEDQDEDDKDRGQHVGQGREGVLPEGIEKGAESCSLSTPLWNVYSH